MATGATGSAASPQSGTTPTPHVAHIPHNRLAQADQKGLIADILRIVMYLLIVVGSCILTWLFIVDALDRFHVIMSSPCNQDAITSSVLSTAHESSGHCLKNQIAGRAPHAHETGSGLVGRDT